MGLQAKRYFNHIINLLIFIFISTCVFSQDNLNFGTTNLAIKQLKIDKYDCKITPSFSINEENPENLKLSFNVVWVDKKGSQVQQPDKISLFIKVNSNIEEYCSSNGKKLSTKPGLFGKKHIELTNSISFAPAESINVTQYSNIHFRDNMTPVGLKVLNYLNSPITMKLVVYIGKEKGNSLEIDDKGSLLSWNIILPEVQQSKEVSCADLENKYNMEYQENKPQFQLSYFEMKLVQLESVEEPPIEKLWELNSELIQYKSNVKSLVSLRENIKNDPNYKKCEQLPLLLGSINNFTTDVSLIQSMIDKVNIAIKNNAGGSGTGGGEPPFEAFDTNNIFCENTFDHLYNIKIDPDLLNDYEPNYLDDLYVKLKNLKVSQDSLYNVILSINESPVYKRAYKSFNANHSESIAIVETLKPDVTNMEKTELDESAPLVSKRRSFPYTWVIAPILLILIAFGVFKYFKYIKKGKSLKEKIK